MRLRPSKSKISSFRPIFHFSYSQKNPKKIALILFDFLKFLCGIFMILFDRFLSLFTLFCDCFKKQNSKLVK